MDLIYNLTSFVQHLDLVPSDVVVGRVSLGKDIKDHLGVSGSTSSPYQFEVGVPFGSHQLLNVIEVLFEGEFVRNPHLIGKDGVSYFLNRVTIMI